MSSGFTLDVTTKLSLELSTAQYLCEIINTPRSLTVWLLIETKQFEELAALSIDPCDYQDHQHFADDYLATSLLQKSVNLPLGIDRTQVALASFWESEERCADTNKRLSEAKEDFPPIVKKAQRLIRKTLGPLNRKTLEHIESNFRFGPGATTSVRGNGSVLSDKYDGEIHLTPNLSLFARSIMGDRWYDKFKRPTIVKGNRFTTVPKNAKTDRGICIEPSLNIYGQLGVGAVLKSRLRRLGIDLSHQQRNQDLAKVAYARNLATIDMSQASDSVSWRCVMHMFPEDWFELFCLFRSDFTQLPGGDYHELEKFSSMGNGYTFELETLIFASVALSCVPLHEHHHVSVYGDDIIVPQAYAMMVIDTLNYLGFKVNTSKSFLAGSFFESCGTDWFEGQPVRPFYLRQDKDNKIPYVVQIANALRLYANRRGYGAYCDARFEPVWRALFKRAPKAWRKCLVPSELGDVGFIVSNDEHYNPRAEDGWEGWAVLTVNMRPIQRRKKTHGRLLAALACPVPDIATRGREPVRGWLGKPRLSRTIVSRWSEGLSWGRNTP